MNFVTAKKPSDIKLAGIAVHFERVNDSLKVVTLTDGKGGVCRFKAGSYESADVTVPAPPKKETKYVLRGELPVVGAIEKMFDEKYEADTAQRELEGAHRGDLNLTVSKEEVEAADESAPAAALSKAV